MAYTVQRAHHRIRYPEEERPHLVIARRVREVIDVAEGGLRFGLRADDRVEVGSRLRGTLHLGHRRRLAIEGEVVRADDRSAAVRLLRPIPLDVVLGEQLFLRSRYKLRDLFSS